MPSGAKIVHTGFGQDRFGVGTVYVWAVVDPEREKVPVVLRVVGTGWEWPDGAEWVGTCADPPFMWHVVRLPGAPDTIGRP